MRDLSENLSVLRGDPVGRVEAVDKIVEARRAEQHLQGVALPVRRVERDEPRRERRLRVAQALLCDLELRVVRLEVGSDPVQLHRRQVISLDHTLEARVELLDLAHDTLRLGLLRCDRRVPDSRGRQQRGRKAQCHDCRRRTSNRAANRTGRWARSAPREGPVRHKFGTLATRPDARKPLFKPSDSNGRADAGTQALC